MNRHPDIAIRQAYVLIVDDEPRSRELLKAILTPEGYLVLTAASGEEALAVVARERPDLILLDLMMPGIDGGQVAREIRSDPVTENIPIIMVTAFDNREAKMLGLTAGVADFLAKPVDRAELCARVRNLIRLKAYGDYYDKYSQMLERQVALRTAELSERAKMLEKQALELQAAKDIAEAASRVSLYNCRSSRSCFLRGVKIGGHKTFWKTSGYRHRCPGRCRGISIFGWLVQS
jgi:DNA-binding response OmpR family regulator